ncbi:hypothetical protein KCP69_05185 [Salmonella enterica subsp. enterica]|nr:hypothetical protein KCP69_05185 [Salmonella enterica subsp. enterica]
MLCLPVAVGLLMRRHTWLAFLSRSRLAARLAGLIPRTNQTFFKRLIHRRVAVRRCSLVTKSLLAESIPRR